MSNSGSGIQRPKVVVIGAGSIFFGRQSIWQMVSSPTLNGGTLCLVDTDQKAMDRMATLARMVIEHTGVSLTLETSIDRKDVLKDADFVVLSFAKRSAELRAIDCAASEKNGVRMCSGDTIGPGGIFRTLREFPVIMQCVADIEALCPDAWVINYINPTAANGIGLRRKAPQIKSFALCDGLHMPHVKRSYAVRAGIVEDAKEFTDEMDAKFDMRIAGVNHFTWLIKAEYEGRDVTHKIADALQAQAATETNGGEVGPKAQFNDSIGYELYRIFGRIPTCVGHTKEYVRLWQGLGKNKESIPPLAIWDVDARMEWHASMWVEVDGYISGKTPISEFMTAFGPDHATDVIEAMVGGLNKPFYINTFNEGAVTNMADDAFLELCCDISMDGPKPRPVGEIPRGLLGMQQQVLDTHELTVEAAVSCDRGILLRAMLTDPMMSSVADAEAIIAELLEAERDALPCGWFE